ncbi:MAG: MarR family transcriptional regulator [Pirellulales bacterium]
MPKSVLQDELRKKHPFECPEQEAALNLLRSQDFLLQQFSKLFAAHGVTGPQYNVLRILRGQGGQGLPCLEIAAQMITRMPDITRLVDRLEQAGLVERSRTSEDRRVVLVSITPAGLTLLAGLDEPVLELHRRSLGHLSAEELAELNRLLVKMRYPGEACEAAQN